MLAERRRFAGRTRRANKNGEGSSSDELARRGAGVRARVCARAPARMLLLPAYSWEHWMYGHRVYSHGQYSYGLYSHGQYSYDLYSHGLYSHGQHIYGLNSYGMPESRVLGTSAV